MTRNVNPWAKLIAVMAAVFILAIMPASGKSKPACFDYDKVKEALERDADVLAVKDITEEAGMAEALDIESKLANQELLATPTPPAQPESAPEKKEPAVEQTPDDEFIFDSVKPIRAKMPD